jgi:hypothetical protein
MVKSNMTRRVLEHQEINRKGTKDAKKTTGSP